jgi:kinesin family protein C2/C3
VSSGQKFVEGFHGSTDGNIVIANGGKTKKTFKFDTVFMPGDDQGILVITLVFE